MIMDIAKEAGSTLRGHVNVIVPCLLESLSEEESAVLNYLAVRSSLDELEVVQSFGILCTILHTTMNCNIY